MCYLGHFYLGFFETLLFGTLFETLFWETFVEYFFDPFVVTLFYLSLSYCISLKYLLFENIAHDGSFQHFITWLYLAVSVCTQLYLPSFLYDAPANYRIVTLLVCLTPHSNNITMAWHGDCLFLQLTDYGDWCATQSIELPLPSFQTEQPIFFQSIFSI